MNRMTWLSTMVVLSACGLMQDPDAARPGGRARAPIVSCPQSPAKEVFGQALCLCGDYRAVGEGLWVRGGSAGVNGSVDVVGRHAFEGDVVAWQGVSGVGSLAVGGSLATPGRVEGVGEVSIGGDLSVGSGLSGVGRVEVKGTLRSGGAVDSVGELVVGAEGPYTALAGPPCACDAAQQLDVGAAIAAAREQHDNEAAGLGTSVRAVGSTRLALGSGSYYFDELQTVGDTTIAVDGVVALFIDGPLESVGSTRFEVSPGATLDLYLRDGLQTVGDATFGAGADPGSVRLYVAGSRSLEMVGSQRVIGAVYAPRADLQLVGTTTFEGGLFARNVEGVGDLEVQFAAPVVHGLESPACQGVLQ